MIAEIKRLHEAMGLDYRLPDLDSPVILGKAIVHDKNRNVSAAGALKLVSEAFLWLELTASTREKIRAIRKLSQVMAETARNAGLEEVSCWVPPEVEPQFSHMLESLGWRRSPWPNWTKVLK